MRNDLSAEVLRSYLDYDKGTGVFTWRVSTRNGYQAGDVAGGTKDARGYRLIGLKGHRYLAHRLAWLHVTGRWPVGQVDHRDTDPSNNRWTNLRDATATVNRQNRRKAQRFNRTGLLGVTWDPVWKKYRSNITVAGRQKFLGRHETAEQAHAAYIAAKRQLHEGNTL